MDVLENIILSPVKVKGLPRAEAEDVARDLLEQVGLTDKIHAHPAQLPAARSSE